MWTHRKDEQGGLDGPWKALGRSWGCAEAGRSHCDDKISTKLSLTECLTGITPIDFISSYPSAIL